jgi:hypothetical protein
MKTILDPVVWNTNKKTISDVERYGKTARGKKELILYLEGKKLTSRQAILARCFDCMGYYADGKVDCHMPHCSLHPFQPYNQNRVKRTTKQTMPGDHVEMRSAKL